MWDVNKNLVQFKTTYITDRHTSEMLYWSKTKLAN